MRATWVLAALALAACDGAAAGGQDAGADAWPSVAPPAAPMFTPCPDGWREVTSDDGAVTTCDPWPAGGYQGPACAFDEAHFAGTPGCARVGTACAADGWPSDLPTDRPVVYVDDDAAAGGDGSSRATAFQTVGAAIASGTSGAVIAIASGRYDELITVGSGMTLWGACVDGTRLTSASTVEADYVVRLGGDGAGLRNLAIDAPGCRGVRVVGVQAASIEGVVVDSARGLGIFTTSAMLSASDVVVRGTRETAGLLGRGIELDAATTATLRRVLVDDARDLALLVAGPGTSLDAADLVLRATRAAMPGLAYGGGTSLQSGTTATLARVVAEDNRGVGLGIADATSRVDATDVVVRGTREFESDATGGYGMAIDSGATVGLARVWMDDDRGAGLVVTGTGSRCSASDVAVTGTREQSADGLGGDGIQSAGGASLTLTRVVVDDNRSIGISVASAGAPATLDDVVVRRTGPSTREGEGFGLLVGIDAELDVARARIESSLAVGFGNVGGRVTVSDLVITDVAPGTDPLAPGAELGGFGIAVNGGTLSAERFEIHGATLCGAAVGGGDVLHVAGLDLRDGIVRGSAVGGCVEIDGYDVERLHQNVLFVDVDVPLQATTYPLPGSVTP